MFCYAIMFSTVQVALAFNENVGLYETPINNNYDGDYVGVMDSIYMDGKKYDSQNATFTITNNNKLKCNFPKIGKMPGNIVLDLPITISSNGVISAQKGVKAGTLKILHLFPVPLKLDELTNAKVDGTLIEFDLKVSGEYNGKNFPAAIKFKGHK